MYEVKRNDPRWSFEDSLKYDWDKVVHSKDAQEIDLNTKEELAAAPYSKDLRDLVNDCMRFRLDDRLTFPQLMRRLQRQ